MLQAFFRRNAEGDRYAVDVDWVHSCSLWHGPLDVDHVRAKTRKVQTGPYRFEMFVLDIGCAHWQLYMANRYSIILTQPPSCSCYSGN